MEQNNLNLYNLEEAERKELKVKEITEKENLTEKEVKIALEELQRIGVSI